MIRCQYCGKPVGVGEAKAGDFIACGKCLVTQTKGTDSEWPAEAAQERIQDQMNESKAEKAGKKRHWW